MKLSNYKWLVLFVALGILRLVDLHFDSPTYMLVYMDQAKKAAIKNKTELALKLYEKAAGYNKTSPHPYYQMALLYGQLNDEGERIKHFKKVVELGSSIDRINAYPYIRRDIEYANACYQVGLDFKNRGEILKAMRLFEYSLNHYHLFHQSSYELGMIYSRLNDKSHALAQVHMISDDVTGNNGLSVRLLDNIYKDHPQWRN